MGKRCDICGTLLKKINGKDFCPNCGIIDEFEDKEDENYDRSYIG